MEGLTAPSVLFFRQKKCFHDHFDWMALLAVILAAGAMRRRRWIVEYTRLYSTIHRLGVRLDSARTVGQLAFGRAEVRDCHWAREIRSANGTDGDPVR